MAHAAGVGGGADSGRPGVTADGIDAGRVRVNRAQGLSRAYPNASDVARLTQMR